MLATIEGDNVAGVKIPFNEAKCGSVIEQDPIET
jgi:hypothetical protein